MAYVLTHNRFRFTETSNPSLVGPGTEYPFGYTLEELGFLWRVKTFRTDFDINIDVTTDRGSYIQRVTFFASYNEVSSFPYRSYSWNPSWDERWLYVGSIAHNYARKMFVNGWKTYRDDVLYSEDDVKVGYWEDNPTNRAVLYVYLNGYKLGGLLYPRMGFDCDAWFSASGLTEIGHLLNPFGQRTLNSSIRLYNPVKPLESVPLYGPANMGVSTAALRIIPEEYYSFDPGDTDPYPGKDGSGPVYDSVTGAQLRNPFAIVKRGDGTFYNPLYTPP